MENNRVLKINQNLQIELAVSENLLDEISTRQEVDLKKVIKDKITTERIQSEYIEGLKYSLIELHKRCKDLEINQITTTSIKSQEIITNTEKTIEVLKSRRLSMDKVESSYKSWNETCKVYFWDMNLLEGELLDQDYTLKGSTLRTLFEAFVTRSMQIECHKFVNVEAHICWCCEVSPIFSFNWYSKLIKFDSHLNSLILKFPFQTGNSNISTILRIQNLIL